MRKDLEGTHQVFALKDLYLIMKVKLENFVLNDSDIIIFMNPDPFDDPKPVNRRLRTQSAPATVRLMRLKSARVYQQPPGGRRVLSAMPRTFAESSLPPVTRELAIGP